MPRIIMSKFALLLACAVVSVDAFAADPTLHQVYQAAEAGNYREAQSMMDQVLRNHPNSAKAHFTEAELLAKQGRAANAQAELATAERLDPGLPFAKPAAVQELKARIATTHTTSQPSFSPVAPSSGPNIPWGMLLAGMALIGAIFFFFRSRGKNSLAPVQSAGVPSYGGPAGSPQSFGTPGYGAAGVGSMTPPATAGMGSGILGSLATGAALGAGMVAGEALIHRVMDGGRHEGAVRQSDAFTDPSSQLAQPQYDMGGNDFGVADASSWDDAGSGSSDDWS
jgi:tetratricopeptide (TPR) repeat protein